MNLFKVVGDKFENLPEILTAYNDNLSDVKEHLDIAGKTLEVSIRENTGWMHYYDERKIELHTLVKHCKAVVERVKAKLYISYKENYSRSLGEREVVKYVENEVEYIRVFNYLLEVEEMYEMYKSVVELFISRNYALNNITKLRVASLENLEL